MIVDAWSNVQKRAPKAIFRVVCISQAEVDVNPFGTLQTTFQCQFSKSAEARRHGVRGYVRVPANNERALMDACTRVGPISIAINASPQSFMFYKGGT